MNQIVLLVLLLALGSYLEINSVDASLPSFYSDTGLSTSLLIEATVDRVQVRVVPSNHTGIYSVCLAYGTQLSALYVSKYEYSALNNSLSFAYNVSLGASTIFQAWSFPDRGSDDCVSIALVDLSNELIIGPDFYLPKNIGDGPQNMVHPVRINSSSDQMMVFLANSSMVRNVDFSLSQSTDPDMKANSLSACNYGPSSFIVTLGVTGVGGVAEPAHVFKQETGKSWSAGNTASPARDPSVAGWPASGKYMICFDNGGNATSTQVLCRASSSDTETIIDDQGDGSIFSKVTVSPVLETHAIVTTLALDTTSRFRLYAVDSSTGELVLGSTWRGDTADIVTHDSHSGIIAVAAIYQNKVTIRILQFNPPNSPVKSPSYDGGSFPSTDSAPSAPSAQGVPQAVQIGVGVSLSVAGAAAGLLVLLLLLKRRNKKKKQSKGDEIPMTKNNEDKTYTNVPPPEAGPYSSMNTTNESTTTGTDDGIATATSVKPSEIDERMHIPYKSLVFVKEIGSGSYGKVYLGEWRGAKVAIKVNNTVTDVDGFLAEAKLTLGIPPHPNLVQTFGVSLDGPNPCIVLEYCGGGSLDNLFDSEKGLTNEKKLEYALKIGYGLLHLHSRNVVHRDLAARNILLTNDGQPKISDFGMSRIVQEEAAKGRTKNMVGPLRWMSPENLKDRSYSLKSDVWSFGITLYEIVVGKEPHVDEDQLEIALKIRNEGATPKIPEDCDPVLRECMEMCWKFNPDDRPSMEEVCNFLRSKSNP